MKKITALILALVLMLSLFGCVKAGPESAETETTENVEVIGEEPAESAPEEPSESSEAGNMLGAMVITPETVSEQFPVVITDAAGRKITVEEKPKRIISGYYISSSMLIALGMQGRMVGIEAKAASRPIYSLAAPELLKLPSVGTAKSFDLEKAVSLKPDLVILPAKLSEAAETLDDMGINVILVAPETRADLFRTLEMIGKACGTDRYEDIIAYFKSAEKDIAERLLPGEEKEVYIAGNSSYLKTAGGGMFQTSMIEAAGALNVADDIKKGYWAEISYEQLLSYDPEAVVIASDAEYKIKDLTSDKMLKELTAVKDGNVYKIPGSVESWDSPVPAGFLGSCYVASCIHPDLYSFDDFMNAARGFYREFYGFTLDRSMVK